MAEKETQLLAAYLIIGNDELKVETIIKRLTSRLEKLGDITFNSQTMDGSRLQDSRDLLSALNTPPLASPYRLVLLKDIDKAGKLITETVVEYLSSPLQTTILVMTAAKITQQSRLYKAVKAIDDKALIDAADRKRSELPAMVRSFATSYQVNLSYDAAAKLVELTGSSTVALNTEVKKLASYVLALGRNEVGVNDVVGVVARTNKPSVWDFVDAFSERDLTQSLVILTNLQGESPVSLLYLCVSRFRELLQYKSLALRREGDLAKALGKPEWQLRRLESMARRFDIAELREILSAAAKADARMKSGENARLVLEELLLAICT